MEKSLPEIIYKFRNWDDPNHKRVLENNELFCAPPNLFNDPFDCKIYKNHHLLDTPEKKNAYVDASLKDHKDWLVQNKRDINKEKFILRQRLNNIDNYQKSHEKIEDKYTEDYMGVVSFSGRWNSILMWSHYANYHQGFCIGLNESKLRNSRLFGKGGNVIYTDTFPVFDPLVNDSNTNLFKPLYKSLEWQYEEEYRMMNLYFDMYPEKPNRIVVFPDNSVEEIMLGLKISDKSKKDIISLAKLKNVPIFQIEKVPYKFELSRIQIL
jgi:hypothetical protein